MDTELFQMDTEQSVEEISLLRESGRTYISLQTEESDVITKILHDHVQNDEDQSESGAYTKNEELSIDDLDSKLTLACDDAKEKINEIFNLKSTFLEQYDFIMKQEQNRFLKELRQNSEELRKIKHLAESYQSAVDLKDSIIGNLVNALQKHKDKYETCRAFYMWRIHCLDTQREKFFNAFATKFYEDRLKRRIFHAWRAATEMGWKERIAYRVRLEMQEQHQNVIEDYEAKIKRLEEELKETKEKIDILHSSHKSYEDMMKQALMRGVCALNVEAMSVLYNSSEVPSQPSVTNLGVPHLSGPSADKLNISSDLSSIQPCPDCLLCPSEAMSERTAKCVSPKKEVLPEQGVIPKTTKIHHSTTSKCIPMMGTANVSSLALKSRSKYLDTACYYGPNVSVQRHINKSTSSLSGGFRTSHPRDQLRRS